MNNTRQLRVDCAAKKLFYEVDVQAASKQKIARQRKAPGNRPLAVSNF
jgi:hypothetical protein